MNLSSEQLEYITALAGACMKIEEICIIMELDHDDFLLEMGNINSQVYKAHQKGYLETKYQVNQKIIDLAKAGSSPAQSSTLKLLQDKEIESNE